MKLSNLPFFNKNVINPDKIRASHQEIGYRVYYKKYMAHCLTCDKRFLDHKYSYHVSCFQCRKKTYETK